jgi:hypothetical protein
MGSEVFEQKNNSLTYVIFREFISALAEKRPRLMRQRLTRPGEARIFRQAREGNGS